MRAICLYLHVHQPYRVRAYSIFNVARDHNYWNSDFYSKQSNERIFKKVAEKSYHPMFDLIEGNIKRFPDFCDVNANSVKSFLTNWNFPTH